MSANLNFCQTLREKGEKALLEATDAAYRDRLVNTRKRVEEAKAAVSQAFRDMQAARAMIAVADYYYKRSTMPQELKVRSLGGMKALIRSNPDAVKEFLTPLESDELRFKCWELYYANIPGFFPTPEAVIYEMLGYVAHSLDGVRVLEPSAGSGNIADILRREGAIVDCVERNHTLREILRMKGHNLIGDDALAVEGTYDLIVMNPPFEKGLDADHITYAFENNLAPGGTLTAVTSEGIWCRSDKKAENFRSFVRAQGHTYEKVPAGAFEASGTGVASRILVLMKPEAEEPETLEPQPQQEPVAVRITHMTRKGQLLLF